MPRYDDQGFLNELRGKVKPVQWHETVRFLDGKSLPGVRYGRVELALANIWFEQLDYDEQYLVMQFCDKIRHKIRDMGLNTAFRLAFMMSRFFEIKGWQRVQILNEIAKQPGFNHTN